MEEIFEYITGELHSEIHKGDKREEDTSLINSLEPPPPVKITPEEIFIRNVRLTGDAVNSYYGRFRTDDLPKLLEFSRGVSCLIGHNRNTAGIARYFGGKIVEHTFHNRTTGKDETGNFIVPKIYWMKSHSKAEDLRINLDGGIYHSFSIGYWYKKATCSICGNDIRLCEHIPGKKYDDELTFFWYDDIIDVVEGSIVFSGAHPGTGIHSSLSGRLFAGINESKRIYTKKTGGLKVVDSGKEILFYKA